MSDDVRTLADDEQYVLTRYPAPWSVVETMDQVRIDAADGAHVVVWLTHREKTRAHWRTVAALIVDRVNYPGPPPTGTAS